jgi:hypothetical protein
VVCAVIVALSLIGASPGHGTSPGTSGLTQVELLARDVAVQTKALPTSVGPDATYCPVEDIAFTYRSVPAGSFRIGAYVEPLIPPGARPDLVTGIAYCRGFSLAIMGFDAVRTDQGWTIWPIPVGDERR